MVRDVLKELRMHLPDKERACTYRKARWIGLVLSLVQIFILFFLARSRTLGADTVHTTLDFMTLFLTARLLSTNWEGVLHFERSYRRVLLFGVITLALGGLLIAGESLYDLVVSTGEVVPPSWPVIAAAFISVIGNVVLHRALGGHEHDHNDALHKNNLDHILADMLLSIATLCAGVSMWLWQTSAFDHWIAIVAGTIVLPYFAWKRWQEGHGQHNDEDHHTHTH